MAGTFSEHVKNHAVVWLLGTLVAGFSAGFGAYKAILEISTREVPAPEATVVSEDAVQVLLAPSEKQTVQVKCPDRKKDRALGIDLSSQRPVEVFVQKDSVWFVTLRNTTGETNRATVQLWCETRG